jgi:hypothetical protein
MSTTRHWSSLTKRCFTTGRALGSAVIWGPFSLCGSRPGLQFPRDFSPSLSITSKTPRELLSKQVVMHELHLTDCITSVVYPIQEGPPAPT